MPTVPNWLANTMEKVSPKYYHSVKVSQVKYITPKLKEIRFEGDFLDYPFVPGNVIEFRINETEFRHYTISKFTKGYCETIIYLHDLGPGSKWAEELQVGQELKLIGPGRKMSYDVNFLNHIVFGDETSIGLALCMAEFAEKNGHKLTAYIEADKSNVSWGEIIKHPSILWIEKSFEIAAKDAIELLKTHSSLSENIYYLTGRAKSIQAVSKFLKNSQVSKKQIQSYPYWAEGKKGL